MNSNEFTDELMKYVKTKDFSIKCGRFLEEGQTRKESFYQLDEIPENATTEELNKIYSMLAANYELSSYLFSICILGLDSKNKTVDIMGFDGNNDSIYLYAFTTNKIIFLGKYEEQKVTLFKSQVKLLLNFLDIEAIPECDRKLDSSKFEENFKGLITSSFDIAKIECKAGIKIFHMSTYEVTTVHSDINLRTFYLLKNGIVKSVVNNKEIYDIFLDDDRQNIIYSPITRPFNIEGTRSYLAKMSIKENSGFINLIDALQKCASDNKLNIQLAYRNKSLKISKIDLGVPITHNFKDDIVEPLPSFVNVLLEKDEKITIIRIEFNVNQSFNVLVHNKIMVQYGKLTEVCNCIKNVHTTSITGEEKNV